MKSAVWTSTYDVNTMVVNPQKRLGLVGLLNILQDVAWSHGTHLGHGYETLMARRSIWVLTRQKLTMSAWPMWGEKIDIRTWVRPVTGLLALRDYEIIAGANTLGECTACWLTLDAATRRPLKIALGDAPITTHARCLSTTPGKIASGKDFHAVARFDVRNSDLDVNGHVNNTRYAQWILDSLPPGALETCCIDAYEVNFLAETGVGDCIAVEQGDADKSAQAAGQLRFQGRREGDGTTVFTAGLRISPGIAAAAA